MQKEFNINLSEKDIYACGRVAVWSSMLDTTMEVAIWTLLDLPKPAARKLTHGMKADHKRQWLAILSKNKSLPSDQRAGLEDIIDQIKAALEDRNRVVHGLWHIGPNGDPWSAKYNKKGNLTFHHPLDRDLIWPIAEQSKLAARRLAIWINARDPQALSAAFPKINPGTKSVGRLRCCQSTLKVKPTKRARSQRSPRSSPA